MASCIYYNQPKACYLGYEEYRAYGTLKAEVLLFSILIH